MGWIETTNENQVAFSDENMAETVVWSDNRTAHVSAELEDYLTETYSHISSTDSDDDDTTADAEDGAGGAESDADRGDDD